MGCDIHIWVEKKNPVTKKWDKMGRVFFDSYGASIIVRNLISVMGVTEDEAWSILTKWRDGEPPSNRGEEYIFNLGSGDVLSVNEVYENISSYFDETLKPVVLNNDLNEIPEQKIDSKK